MSRLKEQVLYYFKCLLLISLIPSDSHLIPTASNKKTKLLHELLAI